MAITDVLRRQSGVISRQQAVTAGLSAKAVDRRLATGRWRQLHPRVYRAVDHPLTDVARIRAAWLWAGPDSVLVGLAAAYWWGVVPSAPREITLAVGRQGRRHSTPGVAALRREITAEDRVRWRGLPTAGLALTVIEAAIALGASEGTRLLDRALQTDLHWRELYRCYCRHMGRRGWKAAAGALGAAADRAASEAERVLVRLLRRAGISDWQVDVEVALVDGRYHLDLAFVRERVAVEVDGWAWHVDVDRFRADRRRQNALVLAGWTVLRFTWADLTNRPDAVLGEIQAAVALHALHDHRQWTSNPADRGQMSGDGDHGPGRAGRR